MHINTFPECHEFTFISYMTLFQKIIIFFIQEFIVISLINCTNPLLGKLSEFNTASCRRYTLILLIHLYLMA